MDVADLAATPVRWGVWLKPEQFALVTRVLGYTSEAELARVLGVDRITVGRAKAGDAVGHRFIAAVLSVFGRREAELSAMGVTAKFEDLFTIGRVAV